MLPDTATLLSSCHVAFLEEVHLLEVVLVLVDGAPAAAAAGLRGVSSFSTSTAAAVVLSRSPSDVTSSFPEKSHTQIRSLYVA